MRAGILDVSMKRAQNFTMDWQKLEYTALINALSAVKIPLLAACTPRVIELSDNKTEVKVRLDWRTQNHLGVMYFGALAMGAELSIALKAIEKIRVSKKPIDFIFKDFKCEFLKRADGHVHFVCEQADQVAALVKKTGDSGDRFSETFEGYAYVPENGTEPVMKYWLTLSMKKRSRRTPSSDV